MPTSALPILNKKGFTIIELLIVIAILGILAMIGFSTFSGIQQSARDAKKKADVAALALAFEKRYNPNTGIYPVELEGADFTSGEVPKAPDNQDYYISPIEEGSDRKTFTVCALLKDSSVFCRQSTNGPAEEIPTAQTLITEGKGGTTDVESGSGAGAGASPSPSAIPSLVPSLPPSAVPSSASISTPTPTPSLSPSPSPSPSPVPSPKIVFVTSGNYRPDLFSPPGLDGADFSCRTAASAAGLTGTYKAWLSDDTGSPLTRFTPSVSGYKKVDGTMVANSWADLLDGSLLSGIDKSESGGNRNGVYVFSNTTVAGGIQNTNTNGHCNRWAYFGWQFYGSNLGLSGQTDSTWTYSVSGDCNWLRALYCFEQ